MTIVWDCPLSVEAYAALGRTPEVPRPCCRACGHEMIFWPGYSRQVRYRSTTSTLWIRRARCRDCEVSDALLPSFLLVKRLDCVEVIGEAIGAIAGGAGTRSAAERVSALHTTARSWWRRHVERARLALAVVAVLGSTPIAGEAPTVVLFALAPGMTTPCALQPELWRSVSLRCQGAWLVPVHHHDLTPVRHVEEGVSLS